MIRVYIKDFQVQKQAYKIAVLHHSGMVVDFDVPLVADMKSIVDKINQAVAFSEVNMAMAFYSGDEVKDGQKLVTTETDSPVHQGDQEVPQVEAGDSGIRAANETGDKA